MYLSLIINIYSAPNQLPVELLNFRCFRLNVVTLSLSWITRPVVIPYFRLFRLPCLDNLPSSDVRTRPPSFIRRPDLFRLLVIRIPVRPSPNSSGLHLTRPADERSPSIIFVWFRYPSVFRPSVLPARTSFLRNLPPLLFSYSSSPDTDITEDVKVKTKKADADTKPKADEDAKPKVDDGAGAEATKPKADAEAAKPKADAEAKQAEVGAEDAKKADADAKLKAGVDPKPKADVDPKLKVDEDTDAEAAKAKVDTEAKQAEVGAEDSKAKAKKAGSDKEEIVKKFQDIDEEGSDESDSELAEVGKKWKRAKTVKVEGTDCAHWDQLIAQVNYQLENADTLTEAALKDLRKTKARTEAELAKATN
ncbi:hypothetical protein K438DRAFT_1993307 [Mycena galopus ATCC 62051]|nr:hypothetical protein K438DRAFT_1993307 [Mycena galopus ATCC 62051]